MKKQLTPLHIEEISRITTVNKVAHTITMPGLVPFLCRSLE